MSDQNSSDLITTQETTGNIIRKALADVMKKNYLDYSVAVIVDRALPDLRDGLKPVHRRILYAMHEAGMYPNSAYKKSARVVGDTMGKYHPHGDSSIYDAAVNMATPWTKLIPLIDGQGNFGSIDGDNPAAMRYCFAEGTRVMTEKGLIKIENLVETSHIEEIHKFPEVHYSTDLNINVESSKGKKLASKWIYSGIQKTLKLTTTTGYEVICTPNEPFLILDENLNFIWKEIQNLKAGDKICMVGQPTKLNILSNQDISIYHPNIKELHGKAKKYDLPNQMTVELSHILGAIVSDGCLRPTNNEIIFSSSNEESFNYFISAFEKVFNTKEYTVKIINNEKGFESKKETKQFSISSIHIFKFLTNLGYTGYNSYDVDVPEIIFHSSKDEVAGFLRAYFDGDGSIYGLSTQTSIVACSVNKVLLQNIKMLLLNYFGIISGKVLLSKEGYRFIISQNSEVEKFNSIGFIINEKNDRLKSIVKSNKGCPSFLDVIPNFKEYSQKFIKGRKVSSRKYISDMGDTVIDEEIGCISTLTQSSSARSRFKTLMEVINNSKLSIHFSELMSKLRDIEERNYFYATIEKIENDETQAVYDLTVPDTHAFTSNGFVVHNTEVKLTKAGAAFFDDISKETVNYKPNYDGSENEPEVLPVSYPNIWVNGVHGIAVGMATYICPHNLNETIDVALEVQKNPNLAIEEMLKIMPGPDFPTGGIVHALDGFRTALETGRGGVKVRAKWHSENYKGQELLIIDELPYQINKKELILDITNKASEKEGNLTDIADIHDESNKEGIRIVITLKKGAIPAVVFNRLAKHTKVEESYNYNVMVLEGQVPKQMGLLEILNKFLDFRREIVTKRVQYDLRKANEKLHIFTGMITVLSDLDSAIKMIRENSDAKSASTALMNHFNIDDIQAKAILDLRLQKLTGLEIESIKKDFEEYTMLVEDMNNTLANPMRIEEMVKNDLLSAKEKFGRERNTEISYEDNDIDMADLIKKEPCLIHVTKDGYLKRMPLSSLESQNRKGKGRSGIQMSDGDEVSAIYTGSTHDLFIVFTKSGKAMSSRVWSLPDGTMSQKGRHLRNIFETLDEPISNLLLVPELDNESSIITVTAKGKVKRTSLSDYNGTFRKKGVQGVGIEDGDSLVSVLLAKEYDHLLLVSSKGKAVRFQIETDILQTRGRKSVGVKGINVTDQAKVIAAIIINGNGKSNLEDTTDIDINKYLLCVGENGVGKRTSVSEFTAHSRGTKGVGCFNINDKTGDLIKAILVTEEEDIIMASNSKTIRLNVKDIRVSGRNTAGTILMNVGDEKVIDVIQVPQEIKNENEEVEGDLVSDNSETI